MKYLLLMLVFIFPTLTKAEVSPSQWLENCLTQPVPEMDKADTEIFIQQADIECLSSFLVVCKGFEDSGACMDEGVVFLDSAFDAAVAEFPDFSAEDSPFLQKRYRDLSEANASDPLDAVEGCDPQLIECDFLARAMRLITIRQSSRAIISKWWE